MESLLRASIDLAAIATAIPRFGPKAEGSFSLGPAESLRSPARAAMRSCCARQRRYLIPIQPTSAWVSVSQAMK
jgi:hypothetical protein